MKGFKDVWKADNVGSGCKAVENLIKMLREGISITSAHAGL